MQRTFIYLMMPFQRFLFLAIGIWCVGGIFGWCFQVNEHELPQENLREWNTMLKAIEVEQIILNNLLVITISLTGLVTAGLTSTFILLINGFIAVLCLKLIVPFDSNLLDKVGFRFFYVPLECLAIWMSSAVGLMGLPHMIKLLSDSKFHIYSKDRTLIIIAYLFSILLIIVAGLLEGTVTTILKQE